MPLASACLATLLLAAPAGALREAAARPVALAQVTIEQRVIIRVPMVPGRAEAAPRMRLAEPAPPPRIRLRETKGPKCVSLRNLQGAFVGRDNQVTMVLTRGEQVRAYFDRECQAADFYSGFYVQPTDDGALCAGRDDFHARNGSTCTVKRFTRLAPDD